jgi:hypothetical protein
MPYSCVFERLTGAIPVFFRREKTLIVVSLLAYGDVHATKSITAADPGLEQHAIDVSAFRSVGNNITFIQ